MINMKHVQISSTNVFKSGETSHLMRATLWPERGGEAICHVRDFHQLILILNGDICLHGNGAVQDLAAGELVFIRPDDRQGLQVVSPRATVIIVAVHPDVIASIRVRFPQLSGHFFWSDHIVPDFIPAALAKESDVEALMDTLDSSSCDRLATEAFLLSLCARLLEQFPPDLPTLRPGAPDWLVAACAATRNPSVYCDGAAGFARACGRTHPHVCRALQRYLGMSPSAYVNHYRMLHAARLLARTNDKISEIASVCGIPNLSHFHRVFLQHHGATPLQYRKAHHRVLI